MDPLGEFTKHLELSGNQDMAQFARQTWQQLEHHAAQGPESYRRFQEKQLSTALGNARPEQLADRVAMLIIETSVASPAGCLLVNTAHVHIRIYRAAPSLAESLSGCFAGSKPASSIGLPAVTPKLLWQSAELAARAEGVIFVDVECAVKAVDAAVEGTVMSTRTHLIKQVLHFLQKKQGVKLTSKSAKLTVVAPEAQEPLQVAHSRRREDLSGIPASTSHMPASLLRKLSVVSLDDATASSDQLSGTAPDVTHQDMGVGMSSAVLKRPLIEELDL